MAHYPSVAFPEDVNPALIHPIPPRAVKPRGRNVGSWDRLASSVAGGILLWRGLHRFDPKGALLALAGGECLRRAITGHSYLYATLGFDTLGDRQDRDPGWEAIAIPRFLPMPAGPELIQRSLTIALPRPDVFRMARDPGVWARLSPAVSGIEELDDRRFIVSVAPPQGRSLSFGLESRPSRTASAWRGALSTPRTCTPTGPCISPTRPADAARK